MKEIHKVTIPEGRVPVTLFCDPEIANEMYVQCRNKGFDVEIPDKYLNKANRVDKAVNAFERAKQLKESK